MLYVFRHNDGPCLPPAPHTLWAGHGFFGLTERAAFEPFNPVACAFADSDVHGERKRRFHW